MAGRNITPISIRLVAVLCLLGSGIVHGEPGGWMRCRLNSGLLNYVSCDFIWTGLGILLFGLFLVPSLLLAIINAVACHPYRSRTKQFFLGVLVGLLSLIPITLVLSASKYFLHHYRPYSATGNITLIYLGMVVFIYYVIVIFFSYRYARSMP